MTDLNELKKLALASTPVGEVVRYEHGGGRMFNGTDLIADTFEESDREFYAVARQECLDLIARLERAEKALEQATVFLDINDLSVITSVFARDIGGIKRCQVPELAAWLKERR